MWTKFTSVGSRLISGHEIFFVTTACLSSSRLSNLRITTASGMQEFFIYTRKVGEKIGIFFRTYQNPPNCLHNPTRPNWHQFLQWTVRRCYISMSTSRSNTWRKDSHNNLRIINKKEDLNRIARISDDDQRRADPDAIERKIKRRWTHARANEYFGTQNFNYGRLRVDTSSWPFWVIVTISQMVSKNKCGAGGRTLSKNRKDTQI